MACREQELLRMLRHLLDNPEDRAVALRLIEEIDDKEEAIRQKNDPFGSDFGRRY